MQKLFLSKNSSQQSPFQSFENIEKLINENFIFKYSSKTETQCIYLFLIKSRVFWYVICIDLV